MLSARCKAELARRELLLATSLGRKMMNDEEEGEEEEDEDEEEESTGPYIITWSNYKKI